MQALGAERLVDPRFGLAFVQDREGNPNPGSDLLGSMLFLQGQVKPVRHDFTSFRVTPWHVI